MSWYGHTDQIVRSVISYLGAVHADPGDPHAAWSAEYAQEQIALAARSLVDAVNAAEESDRPVGW